MNRRAIIANPSTRSAGREVNITDRALRYRANAAPPPGPRICHYCGRPDAIDIEHVDGREENGDPRNLGYACRSCNTTKGIAFKRAKIGRPTRQYNPGGARSTAQWIEAVMSLKGEGKIPLADAIEIVHATPHARRSEFAREIWANRRRSGRTGKRDEVPF